MDILSTMWMNWLLLVLSWNQWTQVYAAPQLNNEFLSDVGVDIMEQIDSEPELLAYLQNMVDKHSNYPYINTRANLPRVALTSNGDIGSRSGSNYNDNVNPRYFGQRQMEPLHVYNLPGLQNHDPIQTHTVGIGLNQPSSLNGLSQKKKVSNTFPTNRNSVDQIKQDISSKQVKGPENEYICFEKVLRNNRESDNRVDKNPGFPSAHSNQLLINQASNTTHIQVNQFGQNNNVQHNLIKITNGRESVSTGERASELSNQDDDLKSKPQSSPFVQSVKPKLPKVKKPKNNDIKDVKKMLAKILKSVKGCINQNSTKEAEVLGRGRNSQKSSSEEQNTTSSTSESTTFPTTTLTKLTTVKTTVTPSTVTSTSLIPLIVTLRSPKMSKSNVTSTFKSPTLTSTTLAVPTTLRTSAAAPPSKNVTRSNSTSAAQTLLRATLTSTKTPKIPTLSTRMPSTRMSSTSMPTKRAATVNTTSRRKTPVDTTSTSNTVAVNVGPGSSDIPTDENDAYQDLSETESDFIGSFDHSSEETKFHHCIIKPDSPRYRNRRPFSQIGNEPIAYETNRFKPAHQHQRPFTDNHSNTYVQQNPKEPASYYWNRIVKVGHQEPHKQFTSSVRFAKFRPSDPCQSSEDVYEQENNFGNSQRHFNYDKDRQSENNMPTDVHNRRQNSESVESADYVEYEGPDRSYQESYRYPQYYT